MMVQFKIKYLVLGLVLFFLSHTEPYAQEAQSRDVSYTVVLHGGAGSYPENVTEEKRELYERTFNRILKIAKAMLESGRESIDVVEACIILMENDTLFNAGKGAVFTADGKHTLDASLMNGKNKEAGAVAGLMHTMNPIRAARLVMDSSVHVLLSGAGGDEFAEKHGLRQVENTYFNVKSVKDSWLNDVEQSKHGTVGCVVLDTYGNLAAGTSTGGMSMKKYGRIGDSPIIGAGTYADNETCAISCTGHGEYFIRYAIAYDIHARMKYGGVNLAVAAAGVRSLMDDKNISGGFIALDKNGNVAKIFNTNGMLTGHLDENGISIKIYQSEISEKK